MAKVSAETYFLEQVLTFGLSTICLLVDAWAVYHTANGFYRIASVPWIRLAYVFATWFVEGGLAFVAINLLRFSFSTRPTDLQPV